MPEFNRNRPQGQRPGAPRRDTPGRGAQGRGGQDAGDGARGTHGGAASRAAVPWYVGDNFNGAPPGHRYLLYLPFWTQNWSAIKEGKQRVLKDLGAIPEHASKVMHALVQRQLQIGNASGAEVIEAFSTAPFATGLGWEHPNENGFAFLQPYGLPYLAGSGVKGVLRRAAQELAESNQNCGWTAEVITQLFGLEPKTGSDMASSGALLFFDVVPEIAGNSMGVDIMNPHYSDYYQGKSTPHDAGSPIPVFFLVVPPGSKFSFVVDCPREHHLPEALQNKWRDMIGAAFTHAFDWLGFGAKTAVGYGAMTDKPVAAQSDSSRIPAGARSRATTPVISEAIWPGARLKFNRANGTLTAEANGKQAHASAPKGQQLLETLPPDMQTKVRRNDFVKVNAVVQGSILVRVEKP